MKKAIYLITNLINKKVYIGQATDPKKRWKYHAKYSTEAIGFAIQKYGVENFNFEILEWTEDYNTRERFWIDHYKSFGKQGYNLTAGGHGQSQIVESNIQNIILELKTSNKFFKTIALENNVTENQVSLINLGKIYWMEDQKYPISNRASSPLKIDDVTRIEKAILEDVEFSQIELQEIFNIERTIFSMINNGKHRLSNTSLCFPLRKLSNLLDASLVKDIENELQTTSKTMKSIASDYGISRDSMTVINAGKHKYSNTLIKFPIR